MFFIISLLKELYNSVKILINRNLPVVGQNVQPEGSCLSHVVTWSNALVVVKVRLEPTLSCYK